MKLSHNDTAYTSYQAVDVEDRPPVSDSPPATVQYERAGQCSHNILSYDTRTLVTYGWVFPTRGSIFHPKIFKYIFVQLVVSTITAKYKCYDTSPANSPSASSEGYCVPLPDSMTALTLLTVTSFLVGLFTNNLMTRWWQIRTALNTVKSKSTNLVNAFTASVAVNTLHCPFAVRAQAMCLTQTLNRYLQLAHALMYIRGNPEREYNEQLLQSRRLLTAHEAKLLAPQKSYIFDHRKSTHVYGWVLLCMEKASSSGILGPVPGRGSTQHVVTFFNELSLIQSAAADVDMFITTQLPYPFIQMTALLVYMFLFQLFFVTAGIIGDGFQKCNPAIYITGYCTQVLMSFVMLGVLHLYVALCNPIGAHGADFPTSTFVLQYEEETNHLVKNVWTGCCPLEDADKVNSILSRTPEQQIEAAGGNGDKGGLPIFQTFNVVPTDLDI